MGGEIETLAAGKPPELLSAARVLVEVIEHGSHELDAAVRWGALTYALEADFHHWICAVAVTSRRATLTFHFGGVLEDPDGRFLAGSSKLLRKLEYASAAEVDRDEVLRFLDQAIATYPWFKEHWRELT